MRMVLTGLLIVGSFSLIACINPVDDSDPEDPNESVLLAASGNPDKNGLDTYKISHAPLLVNQTLTNKLLSKRLATGKLDSAVVGAICSKTDFQSREVFQYIVKCALATSVTVSCSGVNTTFAGGLGVASAWGATNGTCTSADCQEWVSACVMAHGSIAGETGVPIQVAGTNTALSLAKTTEYPNDEGAFWGNLFNASGAGQKRYGCYGSNANVSYNSTVAGPQKLMSRSCAYYDIGGVCKMCDSLGGDIGNLCKSYNGNYLLNFGTNAAVRSCDNLCATDTGSTTGFYSSCTTNGSGTASTRVMTVWRK